jgi:hypothetical protein
MCLNEFIINFCERDKDWYLIRTEYLLDYVQYTDIVTLSQRKILFFIFIY